MGSPAAWRSSECQPYSYSDKDGRRLDGEGMESAETFSQKGERCRWGEGVGAEDMEKKKEKKKEREWSLGGKKVMRLQRDER